MAAIATARKKARGRNALGSAGIASLDERELRYLRAHVRYLLGLRSTRPSRYFNWGGIVSEKRAALIEELAHTFIMQEY